MDYKYYFSIVIPTYNRKKQLKRALDSLVNQTFKDFEVLLVDDGSSDNTNELMPYYEDKLNIRYFYKENGGKHTALNIGIEEANGFMFVIIDSDDLLFDDALEFMHEKYEQIENKEEFAGITAKTCYENGKRIGHDFPTDEFVSSMVDFHFGSGYKIGGLSGYVDCCSCDRTELVKKYRFPQANNFKFVPEYYMYDQIGCEYKTLCYNRDVKYTEYSDDGITQNAATYYMENYLGVLHGLVCRIDNVFPKAKGIRLKAKIEVWLTYWTYVCLDERNIGPRVKKVPLLGKITKIYYSLRKS